MAATKLSRWSSSLLRRAALVLPRSAAPSAGSEYFHHCASSHPGDGTALSGTHATVKGRLWSNGRVSPFSSSAARELPEQRPPGEDVKALPPHRENPPDAENPDPVTLQEQWRYATREYSKWYAHAWGTAIAAGLAFYGIGWLVKGENPLSFGAGAKEEKKQ